MTRPLIRSIDHFVLTAGDVAATIDFYTRALGMTAETFAGGRRALCFGSQKINLHQAGAEFEPKAARPTPGSADRCLIVEPPIAAVIDRLSQLGIAIESGPVTRSGAEGPIESIYLRDPDGNLLELSRYPEGRSS